MTQLRAKQSRALNGSTRLIKLSGKLVRTKPLIQNLSRFPVFFNDFDIVIIFLKTQNNVRYYWLLDPVKLYFSGPPPIDTQSRSTSVGRIKLLVQPSTFPNQRVSDPHLPWNVAQNLEFRNTTAMIIFLRWWRPRISRADSWRRWGWWRHTCCRYAWCFPGSPGTGHFPRWTASSRVTRGDTMNLSHSNVVYAHRT